MGPKRKENTRVLGKNRRGSLDSGSDPGELKKRERRNAGTGKGREATRRQRASESVVDVPFDGKEGVERRGGEEWRAGREKSIRFAVEKMVLRSKNSKITQTNTGMKIGRGITREEKEKTAKKVL